MISRIIEKCDCGEKNRHFDPPLHSLSEAEGKCYSCDKRFEYNSKTVKYKNAIAVQIQDDGKFNDLERLACILLDLDTDKIKVGEKVIITGTIHIRSKYNKGTLIPKVFSEQVEYTNNDQIVIGEKDIEKINEFAKKRNKTIIELLVNMFDPSIIGNRIAKEASIVCLS